MNKKKSDNSVFIGQKGSMSYVMAVFSILQANNKEVVLKARGRAISRAVDVAEIVRTRFMNGKIEVKNIVTGTEVIESKDRGNFSVSTLEITLKQI